MINFIKNNIIYVILLLLFIYKGIFVNIVANVNTLLTKNNNNVQTEINILKEENQKLKNDLKEVTGLKEIGDANYKLTRLSYRKSYTDNEFLVTGSNYKINDLLINEEGVVGMIKELKEDYAVASTIKAIKTLSVKIGEYYGTISEFDGEYFKVTDLSNYDDVHINDIVYTSPVGAYKNIIKVGVIGKIEEHDISKTIYVKSSVDFNNINYLYVVG